MRTRGRALPFAAAAFLLALLLPALALAITTASLATTAHDTYGMGCVQNASDVTCTGGNKTGSTRWRMVIAPQSGEITNILVQGVLGRPPLDSESQTWMTDMLVRVCGAPNEIPKFVSTVGAFANDKQTITEAHGQCTLTGVLNLAQLLAQATYTISGPVRQITPPPTKKPTPKPTAKPTASPTAAPTASPTAEPSPSPSPSPSPTPVPTASPSPSPSPTGVIAPVVATPAPTPTPAPLGGGGGCKVGCGTSSFADALPDLGNIQTDAVTLGGSGALLALILLIIGFAAELFNNTVENNYDEISGWFRKGGLGRVNAWVQRHLRLGVLGFLLLTALVSSFVDPQFGPNPRGLVEFLAFLVGVIVVLASFKGPPMLAHRRKTGELGRLRPLPWALVISATFVLVSRLGNLQPGYLYGIILGAIFTREVSNDEEGRETIYGSIWTLFASLVSWILLTAVRNQGLPASDPFNLFAQTALGCVLVSGLEATAFGLMPLRFMPGYLIYRWNRPLWAVLFGISVFSFIQILIGPTSGYVSALNPAAFLAAGGIFAIFGAFSLLTWGYFRFRPAPEAGELER